MSEKVSLIMTVKNEAQTIGAFLESVRAQNRQPDEFVVVDGGSADRTVDIIEEFRRKGMSLELFVRQGLNISAGRNEAIRKACHSVIAVTDAGCVLEPDWLREIVAPLLSDSAEVATGVSTADPRTFFERCSAPAMIAQWDGTQKSLWGRFHGLFYPRRFSKCLPSSRSVAFRKRVWERVGGYPEWLEAGEDIYFNLALRKIGARFQLCPGARVRWRPRRTLAAFVRQNFRYARGDGQGRMFMAKQFVRLASYLAGLLLLYWGLFWPAAWIVLATLAFVYLSLPTWGAVCDTRKVAAFVAVPTLFVIKDVSQIIGFAVGLVEGGQKRRLRHNWYPGRITRLETHETETGRTRAVHIAIIGTRGIPARYGGFETCAEELAVELVRRGHTVTVYCRRSLYSNRPGTYQGVRLVHLPSLKTKATDTLSHAMLSALDMVCRCVDVVIAFNAANAPACIVVRMIGIPVAINVDGLEWKRGKWGRCGRAYYKLSELLASRVCNRVVADSRVIARYYRETHGVDPVYIPYGARAHRPEAGDVLERYGLEPGRYFLTVTRLEPENNVDLTLSAFSKVATDMKLVVVGGVAGRRSGCAKHLRGSADKRVQFLGPLYPGEGVNAIWTHCYAYVHGNEVGGTNPALLQAMAYGNCVLALDVPFNVEVVEDGAILFRKSDEDLAEKMQLAADHPETVAEYRKRARERVEKAYTWPGVCDAYERLCYELKNRRRPATLGGANL